MDGVHQYEKPGANDGSGSEEFIIMADETPGGVPPQEVTSSYEWPSSWQPSYAWSSS